MQDIKEAYRSAKKELDAEVKRKLIDEMKGYIQSTLQAIEDKKSEISEKQQELKALKADLDDLQEGRLDKIKERQDKDPISRRVSVIIITKIINNYPSVQPYFQPYWEYFTDIPNTIPCISGTTTVRTGTSIGILKSSSGKASLLSAYCSNDVSGTYVVKSSNGGSKAFYING